jgi:hypothetical protein
MELHEEIRRIARKKHVLPAVASRQTDFSIAVRDLMKEAEEAGIYTGQRVPAFCRSIQTQGFLEQNGLSITRVEGPKSGLSTRVIIHYRLTQPDLQSSSDRNESAEEWAVRVTAPILGLMKEKIAKHGGAQSFLKWVRSEDEGQQ